MQLVLFLSIFNVPYICRKIRCDREYLKKVFGFRGELSYLAEGATDLVNPSVVKQGSGCRGDKDKAVYLK